MSYHETRVDASLLDQKSRQAAVGGVYQPLLPPLADVSELVCSNCKIIQGLNNDVLVGVV